MRGPSLRLSKTRRGGDLCPRGWTFSLVVNAGLADSDVICNTLPHLLRTHRVELGEVLLVVDGRPPTGRLAQSVVASAEAIRNSAPSFENVRVIGGDCSAASRAEVNRVWFGRSRVADRCSAGTPIFSFGFGLHHARMPYRIHMDCDMLVHDAGPHSWAEKGVELLQANADVMFVSPMMGPPGPVHEFRAPIHETRGLRLAHSFGPRQHGSADALLAAATVAHRDRGPWSRIGSPRWRSALVGTASFWLGTADPGADDASGDRLSFRSILLGVLSGFGE
jgi:hypothetical protein